MTTTCCSLVSVRNGVGADNTSVWRVATGELVYSCIVKKVDDWQPQWTEDESIMGRSVTNTVFLHSGDELAASTRLFTFCLLDDGFG